MIYHETNGDFLKTIEVVIISGKVENITVMGYWIIMHAEKCDKNGAVNIESFTAFSPLLLNCMILLFQRLR